MRRLETRLAALEGGRERDFVPWALVLQGEDQTEEEAFAAHEAEHGPIGDRNVFHITFDQVAS